MGGRKGAARQRDAGGGAQQGQLGGRRGAQQPRAAQHLAQLLLPAPPTPHNPSLKTLNAKPLNQKCETLRHPRSCRSHHASVRRTVPTPEPQSLTPDSYTPNPEP